MQYLHTMLRVQDLDKALTFFQGVLGFEIAKRTDMEKYRNTLVEVRAPNDVAGGPTIELSWSWDGETYENGNAFGHLAYRVDDLLGIEKKLADKGLSFSIPAHIGPDKSAAIAFFDDIHGFRFELQEFINEDNQHLLEQLNHA